MSGERGSGGSISGYGDAGLNFEVRLGASRVELDRLFDICDRFFQRGALRLTALEFRTPGVKAVLIFQEGS